MFIAALSLPHLWQPFLLHPVLRDSLSWVATQAESAAEGIHELGPPGWFVNVHGYTTRPTDECQWENHLHTVDLQYLIAGREGIRVRPVAELGTPTLYREESDTQKFTSPAGPDHFLAMQPGDFAIFMPGDAHCPKIAIGEAAPLRKLVVKIPRSLLD